MVSAKVLDVTKASSDLWELDFDLEGEQKGRRGRRGGEGSVWREGSTMTFLLFIFLDLLLNVTAAVLLWVQVFGDTVLLKAGWNEAYRFSLHFKEQNSVRIKPFIMLYNIWLHYC